MASSSRVHWPFLIMSWLWKVKWLAWLRLVLNPTSSEWLPQKMLAWKPQVFFEAFGAMLLPLSPFSNWNVIHVAASGTWEFRNVKEHFPWSVWLEVEKSESEWGGLSEGKRTDLWKASVNSVQKLWGESVAGGNGRGEERKMDYRERRK